jgi:sugar phosphate isomerase/epimerase
MPFSSSSERPLGLAHFTVLEVPPADLISLAADIGYATVGMRLHPAFPGAPAYEARPGTAESRRLKRRIADTGVSVHDIEFVTMGPDFAPARLLPVCEAAGELGARRLSVCGDDPDPSRLAARLAELCDLAAPFGLGVDVEWMAWRAVGDLQAALTLVAAADHPGCGLLIDALHLARTGGSPAEVARLPSGMVRSVQLCDAPAARPIGEAAMLQEARAGRLPPGEGELPLAALLGAAPPDAVLSVEVPMTSSLSAEVRARQIFEATRRLLTGADASFHSGS